jgi:drug/metabolite transporter (DMT)-like permease
MYSLILLLLITLCYAAYNLLVKVSGDQTAGASPILATITLQAAALGVSVCYLLVVLRQGAALSLPGRAFQFAALAGICIGLAEVMYFYLFRGVSGEAGMPASQAIPVIVGGTIVISALAAVLLFGERPGPVQWLGITLAGCGMLILALD